MTVHQRPHRGSPTVAVNRGIDLRVGQPLFLPNIRRGRSISQPNEALRFIRGERIDMEKTQ